MPEPTRRQLVVRATALGFGAAALPVGAVLASGLWPRLDTAMVLLGLGGTWLALALSCLPQVRLVDAEGSDPRLDAIRLQGLLALSFLIKLAIVAIGTATLWLAGLKFEAIATFAVAFVTTALVGQVVAAGFLFRVLGRAGSSRGSENGS